MYKRHTHTATYQDISEFIQNDNNNNNDEDDDDDDVTLLETRSLCIVNGFSRS